jgi:SAM-dependent methyltransferase
MSSYGPLSAQFYDLEKGWAPESEVDFFAELIFAAEPPVLEAMCGSGRLLIPLLKRGINVEGVDFSAPMLARLRERGGETLTYCQSLESLSLPKKYGLIFIVLGSFQLLPRAAASSVLSALRRHLKPGGQLVIDTFIPWELIQSGNHASVRKATDGRRVIELDARITVDAAAQRYRQINRYSLDGQTEEEVLAVEWYLPEEFISRLNEAGFDVSVRPIPPNAPKPRRYLYTAIPREDWREG